jgi:hypothetical protein
MFKWKKQNTTVGLDLVTSLGREVTSVTYLRKEYIIVIL